MDQAVTEPSPMVREPEERERGEREPGGDAAAAD
jgi:hypothetical protein